MQEKKHDCTHMTSGRVHLEPLTQYMAHLVHNQVAFPDSWSGHGAEFSCSCLVWLINKFLFSPFQCLAHLFPLWAQNVSVSVFRGLSNDEIVRKNLYSHVGRHLPLFPLTESPPEFLRVWFEHRSSLHCSLEWRNHEKSSSLVPWFLNLSEHPHPPDSLWTQNARLHPRVCDPEVMQQGLRICISNQFQGAEAAGPQTTNPSMSPFGEPPFKTIWKTKHLHTVLQLWQ